MLESLKKLASHTNVSGCEDEMSSYLMEQIREFGYTPELNDNTSVCVKIKAKQNSAETVMVSVALDVPGFIALFVDEKSAYLSATKELPFEIRSDFMLVNEKGELVSAKKESDKKTELITSSEGVTLGDVFGLPRDLSEKKGKIEGYFACKYAVILLLLDLMQLDFSRNVIFAFASNASTSAAKMKNIAKKYSPDRVITIGTMEHESARPLILVKDGNYFADDQLVRDLSISKGKKRFQTFVSEKSVTQADKIFSFEAIPCIPLALPFHTKKDGKEVVSVSSYDLLKERLKEFLTQ